MEILDVLGPFQSFPRFFSPFLNCGSGENACRFEVKMLEEEKEKNHAGGAQKVPKKDLKHKS